MLTAPDTELNEVLSHYDLGQLAAHERDRRGTVNTSYFIDMLHGGRLRKYFLRRYKLGIRREEILFEHALIGHIFRQQACPVARVHPTRAGETFIHRPDLEAGGQGAFYAVFDYLPGEDRYTWVGPRCTPRETRNAGALLARFHRAVSTLTPPGKRVEPKIVELLDVIDGAWVEGRAKSKGTVFDADLAEHFELIRGCIAETRAALQEPAARAMPEVIIHSDFHPGNLKFEGEAISGLVDFDWAKVDLRAFDLGLALWYFCVSWEPRLDGRLRLGDAQTFLAAYQRELHRQRELPPLSEAELGYLPHLVNAGNIYVIYWTIRDYFGKEVDAQEYRVYLNHHGAFARWFNRPINRANLAAMLAGLPRS